MVMLKPNLKVIPSDALVSLKTQQQVGSAPSL